MINFRFHIASLIAVFLALAVGIFVGSTVVDQAIVENLDRQIDRVERKADERKAENDRLKSDLDRLGAYIEGSAPFSVERRLTAVQVAVIAERGVGGAVKRAVELLQQAGADAPEIVWLESAWRLDKPGDVARLTELIGDTGTPDDIAKLRRRGLSALTERLADSGAAAGTGTTTTTARRASQTSSTTAEKQPDLLDSLERAGFVSIEEVGDQGSPTSTSGRSGTASGSAGVPAVRVLAIGGTTSELLDTDVLLDLARACVSVGAPTAVAEVYAETDGGPDRGAVVSAVVGDDALEQDVTTIDDLDLVEGRVSAVIGLEELSDGTVGHYGYGSGASRSLPEWTGR